MPRKLPTFRGPRTDTRWQRLERVRGGGKVTYDENLILSDFGSQSIFLLLDIIRPWIWTKINKINPSCVLLSISNLCKFLFSFLAVQCDPVQQWPLSEHKHQVNASKTWDLPHILHLISWKCHKKTITISALAPRIATGPATQRTSAPPRAEAWQETARLGKGKIIEGWVGTKTRTHTMEGLRRNKISWRSCKAIKNSSWDQWKNVSSKDLLTKFS